MTLYILDEDHRREKIVEGFKSLIWTERYAAYGDFELTVPSTKASRALLVEGVRLGHSESNRVMKIETKTDETDADGRKILKLVGPSIEKLLNERVGYSAMTGTENSTWTMTGTPGNIAREIFAQICMDGVLSYDDIIPSLSLGNIFPPDTIPESNIEITVELKPGTVYNLVKEMCDKFELGFRLVKGNDDGMLYFNVYAGSDRTSMQSAVPAVVFSQELDNLSNVSELASEAEYRNVAYVFSGWGSAIVQSPDSPGTVDGFDRRVMLVEVTDNPEFTGTGPEIAAQAQAYLTQVGRDALLKQKKVQAFDGEISQTGLYQYNRDYILGDLVEMRNSDQVTKLMRVSEQIFVEDAQGKRSYPTLTDVLFITPGSWLAWDYNMTWSQVPDTLVWATA